MKFLKFVNRLLYETNPVPSTYFITHQLGHLKQSRTKLYCSSRQYICVKIMSTQQTISIPWHLPSPWLSSPASQPIWRAREPGEVQWRPSIFSRLLWLVVPFPSSALVGSASAESWVELPTSFLPPESENKFKNCNWPDQPSQKSHQKLRHYLLLGQLLSTRFIYIRQASASEWYFKGVKCSVRDEFQIKYTALYLALPTGGLFEILAKALLPALFVSPYDWWTVSLASYHYTMPYIILYWMLQHHFKLFSIHFNKVITTMVTGPLDDRTYCARSVFTHLGLWQKM